MDLFGRDALAQRVAAFFASIQSFFSRSDSLSTLSCRTMFFPRIV
jgi:hypothetical protein